MDFTATSQPLGDAITALPVWRSSRSERAFKRRCIKRLSIGGDSPNKFCKESLSSMTRSLPMILGSLKSTLLCMGHDFCLVPSNSLEECVVKCLLFSDSSLLESEIWPYGWLSSSVDDVDSLGSRFSAKSSRFKEKCWSTTRFTAIADSANAESSRAELFLLEINARGAWYKWYVRQEDKLRTNAGRGNHSRELTLWYEAW